MGGTIVAPPSVSVLLAGFGSDGPAAVIPAVFTGVPGAFTSAAIVTEPSDTSEPGPAPEARVQVTSWPLTRQDQPLPGEGVTDRIV